MTPVSTALPPAVRLPRRTHVEHVMGLPVSVLLRGPRVGNANEALAALCAELHDVDAVFSPYRGDSAVSRLRRGDLSVADCPADVAEVLALCDEASVFTDGLFDAAVVPGGLDPSGLVKGWAVERAVRRYLHLDDIDYCINAGGDVLARTLPGRTPWRIGIEDPHDRTRVLAVVEVTDGAVATSGTASRGAHIIDPRSGVAADAVASVTVRGPSLATADVLATAAFVRGSDAAQWVSARTTYEALVVGLDGTQSCSAGWTVGGSEA